MANIRERAGRRKQKPFQARGSPRLASLSMISSTRDPLIQPQYDLLGLILDRSARGIALH